MRSPLPLIALAVLAACSSSPPPAPQPAPIVTTPAPAPAPTPAPTIHAEAHVDHGHITLEHQITFDSDSDHIQEQQSSTVLADLVSLLNESRNVRRVRIEGHTDLRGDAAHNQDLSQRRAQAVATYLRGHGFASIEFEAVGYGVTQPLCREDTPACNERNRRVEFTITDPPAP